MSGEMALPGYPGTRVPDLPSAVPGYTVHVYLGRSTNPGTDRKSASSKCDEFRCRTFLPGYPGTGYPGTRVAR
eukprot:2613275-Rhodomonas_salina.1